jgi:transcriptional regulator of met regulon
MEMSFLLSPVRQHKMKTNLNLKEVVSMLYSVTKLLLNTKTKKLVRKTLRMAVTLEKAESFYNVYLREAKLDVYNGTCYAVVRMFEPATHLDGELLCESPKQMFKEETIEAIKENVSK